MARKLKQYKGFFIKETTERELAQNPAAYKFLVTDLDNLVEWECDNLKEAEEFIDGYESPYRGGPRRRARA